MDRHISAQLFVFAVIFLILAVPVFSQLQVSLGPEELVFDWTTQRCATDDVPDAPARAFIDADGRVQVIDTHFTSRRFRGNTLDTVAHECGIIFSSSQEADPSHYNDKEWIAAPYTFDGQTIYALIHDEFQGSTHPGVCPSGNYFACWYNAITFALSTDRGQTYSQLPPPSHLVASVPYPYDPSGSGAYGFFNPSSIILKDGFYYSFLHTEAYGLQDWGSCPMRTANLADPSSWRLWNGNSFSNIPVNPYPGPVADPQNHICVPVDRNNIGKMAESLTYNTYLGKYVLVGSHSVYSSALGRDVYGFYFSLSDDLIHWTPAQLLMEANLPWSPTIPAGTFELYPSLLEQTGSRNFEVTSQQPYLYFTRKNNNPAEPNLDRDLIRRRITFTLASSAQPPAIPTGLVASALGGSVILSWSDNANNEDNYVVQRRISGGQSATIPGSQFATIAILPSNTVSFSDNAVSAGTSYEYRVYATNNAGSSGFSNIAPVTTPQNIPAAPTNLVATAAGPSSVSLTWTDNSNNEQNFVLERQTGSGSFAVIAPALAANTVSYTDNTVSLGITYTYRVRAANTGGSSAWSTSGPVTVQNVPATPANLTATSAATAISLFWSDNANNEDAYIVQRRVAGGLFTNIAALPANALSFSDYSVSSGVTYEYRVYASNTAGNSGFSNVAGAIIQVPPSPPTSLIASSSGGPVSLSWSDNANNEESYVVQRRVSGQFSIVAVLPQNTVSFSDNAVSPGTSYEYRVYAANAAGNSGFSNTAAVTTPQSPVPAAPSNLTASAASTQVILHWIDNSQNENSFRVEKNSGTGFVEVGAVSSNIQTFTDAAVSPATAYSYRVRSSNTAGFSGYSNIVSVTTPALSDTVPPVISVLSILGSSPLSGSVEITASATDNVGVVGVQFLADGVALGNEDLVPPYSVVWVTSLVANGQHTISARARDAAGNFVSISVNVTVANVPSQPTSLTAFSASANSISLVWTDTATNEQSYVVEQSSGAGPFVQIASLPGDTTAFVASGLTPNTPYSFRVRAYNTAGFSPYSNAASASTIQPVDTVPPSVVIMNPPANESGVILSWQPASDNMGISGYRVDISTNPEFTSFVPGWNNNFVGNALFATVTGVQPGTTYYARVRAVDTSGNVGPVSSTVQAHTTAPVCTDSDEDGFFASENCGTAIDCDDHNPLVSPNAPEICGNGVDENCDGRQEACVIAACDGGLIRSCNTALPGECREGVQRCSENRWGPCKPVQISEEVCDGIDNNCNGIVDDECGQQPFTCTNNIQDPNEEGVDCGGRCLQKCPSSPLVPFLFVGGAGIAIVLAALILRRRTSPSSHLPDQ